MSHDLQLAVVGLGYWGPNLLRAALELEDVAVTTICDSDTSALARYGRRYPGLGLTHDFESVIASDQIDAVLLATPIATHYPLAKRCLEAGKHVLVEKPLASSVAQARELADSAEAAGLVAMPGHTFVYSPPVVHIKEMLDADEVGEVYFGTSTRVNLGIHQRGESVVQDLGPHDFSIFLYWFGEPSLVRAVARDAIVPGTMDVAFIDLIYPDGSLVHLELSWLAPTKLRRTVLVGTRRMVVYDDSDVEQVRVFDRGVNLAPPESFGEWKLQYRSGDILSPRIDSDEPLRVELQDFVGSIREQRRPRSDAASGVAVVRMLEATELSLLYNSAPVSLDSINGERRGLPDRRRNVSGRPASYGGPVLNTLFERYAD